ncbi:MAG: RNA-binding protein [bacterium]|nr:RNA-binding protein [bacterium]
MGRRLFVGSLSFSVNEDKLRDFFSQVGTVNSVKIITDRYTHEPRGFGFVDMSTEEEAQDAISQLNGQPLDGQPVVVNEAREKKITGGIGGTKRRFVQSGGKGSDRRKSGHRGGSFGGGRRNRF